jgi:hypothetical protein
MLSSAITGLALFCNLLAGPFTPYISQMPLKACFGIDITNICLYSSNRFSHAAVAMAELIFYPETSPAII